MSVAGNSTLGSASGDDVTFNGSLASSIPIKSNATYDIGAATTGLAGIYYGNNTRTVRMVAGVITSSYTITLPVAAPAKTGMVQVFNASATSEFRFANKLTSSKTALYTATSDETVIPCDTSAGAFTVNLPASSGNSGLVLTILKTSASDFNAVTIDADGSETISGSTTKKITFPRESIRVICDGSNWHVLERNIPQIWHSFTPTGTWSSNTTYTGQLMHLSGNVVRFQYKVAVSGAPTSATLTLDLPNSWNVNETNLLLGALNGITELVRILSSVTVNDFNGSSYVGQVEYRGTSTSFNVRTLTITGTDVNSASVTQASPMTWANQDNLEITVDFPISEIDT